MRSFADVAHQTLTFDPSLKGEQLILQLIDSPWVQRLRNISQTGSTRYVYMSAEHSRFGHSLGVAYLTKILLNNLKKNYPEQIAPYELAVLAASLLHDIGHVAPGSHLAEKIWLPTINGQHEQTTARIIREDSGLNKILTSFDPKLPETIVRIIEKDPSLPRWTVSTISGSGWNADRGNWSILDSVMCAVSYGRYNVLALIDAFQLSPEGDLVLQENRLDALTHFFVARDSMYRQVYQHRVLQTADAMTCGVVIRLREIIKNADTAKSARTVLADKNIFADKTMLNTLFADRANLLDLEDVFAMTESWWRYHLDQWCKSDDQLLNDLSKRICNRELFKTIRLETIANSNGEYSITENDREFIEKAKQIALQLEYNPKYYVLIVDDKDKHRVTDDKPPLVLLDNGKIISVTEIEPMINNLWSRPSLTRVWLVVPKDVKKLLGRDR